MAVADLGLFFRGDDFENPTRTENEGVWAYGRILRICELKRNQGGYRG